MKWRGMRCPKCKAEYPRGARFCPNCGFEPMNRSNVVRNFIGMPIGIGLLATVAVYGAVRGDWFVAGGLGLASGIFAYAFIAHLRWVRPERTNNPETTVTSGGTQSQP